VCVIRYTCRRLAQQNEVTSFYMNFVYVKKKMKKNQLKYMFYCVMYPSIFTNKENTNIYIHIHI